jgi:hypothetical protein
VLPARHIPCRARAAFRLTGLRPGIASCRTVSTHGAARGCGNRIWSFRTLRFPIDTLVLVAVFAWLVGFGAAAAYVAARRRRNPLWWAVLGAILGPIALLILQTAPPGRCRSCAARTVGWSTVCAWCGEDVRGPARLTMPLIQEPETAPDVAAPVPAPAPLMLIHGSGPSRPDGPAIDTVAHVSPAPIAADAAADGPVHRLKGVLGPTAESASAPAPAPMGSASDPDLEGREIVLASAIYVTGTRGLQAGSRYGIALIGTNLGILGPVDVDPSAIAALRPLHGLDATGAQGQLIITAEDGFLNRFAMVFMALAGGTPERVAEIIVTAASGEAIASR